MSPKDPCQLLFLTNERIQAIKNNGAISGMIRKWHIGKIKKFWIKNHI